MPAESPSDLPVVSQAAGPCRHLRNKGMYVYTDGSARPPHDDHDGTPHWCLKTMTNYGPDDEMVGRADCQQSGRSCHEPI